MRSSAASDLAEADARGGTSDLVNDDRSRRADAAVQRAPRRGSAASWAPPLVVVGATLAAYLPVVIIPYAFEDDYWILGATHGLGGRPVWQTASAGGRPLQGLLLMGIFSVVPDIDSLRLVRLVSVVGVALLGVLVYVALRRSGISRWLATAAALSVVTLPSFQVYASWAVLFEAPFAAILAGLAWLCASSALGGERRALLVRGALAAGLLFTALLIYQPAAMFFWVFAAIDVLPRNVRLVDGAKTLGFGVAVAVVALAGAYVVTKVAVQHYGAPGGGRSTLTHDVVGKVRWFWDQPLPNALNLFNLVPKWTIAGVTIAVATLGILLLHARRR
ncbi:MAG TPA: glucosyltransferase domain-containing protein, partial [Gaiellaceae bacterium]|nr:glucosyltransferase domain-containing protein [Gaiellaceae bacterium]